MMHLIMEILEVYFKFREIAFQSAKSGIYRRQKLRNICSVVTGWGIQVPNDEADPTVVLKRNLGAACVIG